MKLILTPRIKAAVLGLSVFASTGLLFSESVAAAVETTPVIFVGNNWDGMIDVIDASSYEPIARLNGVPDKEERKKFQGNIMGYIFFYINRYITGEGHDQFVDDMYSTLDGRLLVVSRPSFGDVVALDIESGAIEWRFEVDGLRSDHMALSPDGTQVAVSASTGNVVHLLNIETGEEEGKFESGASPHENVYSKDGSKIYHASIGLVWSWWDSFSWDSLKGNRLFKVIDTDTSQEIKSFSLKDKLTDAGYEGLSSAIRPMTHTSDERFFYFQLSFLHGFVEYDMLEDKVTNLIELPNLIPDVSRNKYVNDSAHHGIALSGDDTTFCVAGTMDDYVAIVDRATLATKIMTDLGTKPYWVTSDKSGENCYVSWSGTDAVSVISYATGEEIAHIAVGDHPQRIREGYVRKGWGNL